MVIDTSAVMAIVLREPDARRYSDAIENDGVRLIAAPTVLEAAAVLDWQFDEDGAAELDYFLIRSEVRVTPFGSSHLDIARLAYRRYGKGRHPAGLNFGDCFSYALSVATGEPLLYKGDDFAKTDVLSALQP